MSLELIYFASRWLHFAALFTLTGCGFYCTLLAPRRYQPIFSRQLRAVIVAATLLCLFSAWTLLMAQVGLVADGWQDVARFSIWAAVLDTEFGHMWLWQLLLPLVGLMALNYGVSVGNWLGFGAALLQLAGLAMVGHGAMHSGTSGMLQHINQTLHLISAAYWTGGLVPLLFLLRPASHPGLRYDAIRTMMRFSFYGHLAVALVVVTGLIDGLVLLGWPLRSFHLYSQLLLAKIVLVAGMVLIALFNRYWLVPRFKLAGDQAQRRFIATTFIELLFVAAVLSLVAVFATLEPG